MGLFDFIKVPKIDLPDSFLPKNEIPPASFQDISQFVLAPQKVEFMPLQEFLIELEKERDRKDAEREKREEERAKKIRILMIVTIVIGSLTLAACIIVPILLKQAG